MYKRVLSVLFVVSLLLGFLPSSLQISAAEDEAVPDAVNIQILREPFAVAQESGFEPLGLTGNYCIYTMEFAHTGLLDIYGNMLLPPVYYTIKRVSEDIFAINKEFDTCYALYRGGVQITDFVYWSVEANGMYIYAKHKDDSTDFYYLDGTRVKLPTVPNGWEIYGLVGDQSALLRRVISQSENYKRYEYNFCTWDGKMILPKPTDYAEITKIYGSENIIAIRQFGPTIYYKSNGEKLGEYADFQWSTKYSKYLAYKATPEYYFIYVYDEDFNLLLETIAPMSTTGLNPLRTEFDFLTSELFYVSINDKNHKIYNMDNVNVLNFEDGNLIQVPSFMTAIDQPYGWGFATLIDGVCSIYDESGNLLLRGEEDNITSVSIRGEYVIASGTDGTEYFYSKEGQLLFTTESGDGRSVFVEEGILLSKKDGLYAVCDLNGQPITEHVYEHYLASQGYGILNMRRRGETGYYLVNAAGEEQNQEAFPTLVRFMARKASYTYDGEMFGILRYVAAGESQFADVSENAWYFDAVEYCYENQLFSGTQVGRFSPEDSMTRAMLVTVLWRLDGKPSPETEAEFMDVNPGSWYSEAVSWAAENRIVNGIGNGKFDPDGNVTREQMATILYRYGQWKGYDMTARTELSAFPDAGSISGYATDAISWANAEGIIGGSMENDVLLLMPQ